MSFNLTLEVDGEDVDLSQTPTEITLDCLFRDKGEDGKYRNPRPQKEVFEKYKVWILSRVDSKALKKKPEWMDADTWESLRPWQVKHIEKLEKLLAECKEYEFSYI